MRYYLFLILACLSSSFVDASGKYYNHKSTIQTAHPDWMRWLPDDFPLSRLSMPGTHDTMADTWGGPVQTQSLSLQRQLEAGIRVLDIRGRHQDNKFKIFHNICDLGYWFGDDVLGVCVDFLRQHPSETIFMKIGAAGVPDPEDVTRPYWETFQAYRDDPRYRPYFWMPPNPSVMPSLPLLGEVRGKIIVIQTFSSPTRFGFDHVRAPFNKYNSWKISSVFGIKENWEEKRQFIENVNSRSRGERCYLTGLSGNSFWAYPNVVSGGFLGLIRGINDYALQYIFEQNHTNVGTLYLDFPGAGLIDAIIAKNMKHATVPGSVASDFNYVVKNICYSLSGPIKGSDGGRAGKLRTYLEGIIPQEKWGVIVAKHGWTWGAHIANNGLHATSKPIGGYRYLAFNLGTMSSSLPLNVAETVRELAPIYLAEPQVSAQEMSMSLKERFPSYRWSVFVKNPPCDDSEWSFDPIMPCCRVQTDTSVYLVWAEEIE